MENEKYRAYTRQISSQYFWRTYQGQEIGLIQENQTKLSAYEIKRNPKKNIKTPPQRKKSYPQTPVQLISPDRLE